MKITMNRRHGLSLLEVFVVIVIAAIALLIVFLMPSRHSKVRAKRISCVNNLKQLGLASRLYAGDHEDKFPWMVSTNFNPTNTSGSREFTNSAQVFSHFQAMSNELNIPKILVCISDGGRQRTSDFTNFGNSNVSYFVNLDVLETNPQTILSGDRNITGGTFANPNLLLVRSNSRLSWTKAIHVSAGNVGLADGSVQQMTPPSLNKQIAEVTNTVFRLAIP